MTGYVRQTTKFAACRFGAASLVVVLASAVLAGCSADDESAVNSDTATGGPDYCTAMCSWYRACGQDVPESCVAACRFDNEIPSYARTEFLELVAKCLAADLNCSGGSEASWQTCYREAAVTIEPNQTAFDTCGALGRYFFECGYTEAPDGCAGSLMYYGDSTLPRLSKCDTASCGELSSCIDTNLIQR